MIKVKVLVNTTLILNQRRTSIKLSLKIHTRLDKSSGKSSENHPIQLTYQPVQNTQYGGNKLRQMNRIQHEHIS